MKGVCLLLCFSKGLNVYHRHLRLKVHIGTFSFKAYHTLNR